MRPMPDSAFASSPALGRLTRIEAWALRAPIATPVVTSFGTMRDRPAVFVRVTGAEGAQGWGEVWCNFPGVGAEHRARLLIDTVAPLVLSQDWPDVATLWQTLNAKLRVLAIQTGEPGPLAQCVAAIDLAAWDLVARRAGQPLWRMLGGTSGTARVYASGLHPDEALALAVQQRERGHRAFKMKVGFAPEKDESRLRELRARPRRRGHAYARRQPGLGRHAGTRAHCRAAGRHPHPADLDGRAHQRRPHADDWAALARGSALPLAAGENVRGVADFEALLATRALAFVQPDVGKWDGLTACREVALRAPQHGATFCPRWLGGPLGLVASMHLRAALGDAGYVEWDANPNPVHAPWPSNCRSVRKGRIALGEAPALGLAIDIAAWQAQFTWQGRAGACGLA